MSVGNRQVITQEGDLPDALRAALDEWDDPRWVRHLLACANAGGCRGCGDLVDATGDPITRWCGRCLERVFEPTGRTRLPVPAGELHARSHVEGEPQ